MHPFRKAVESDDLEAVAALLADDVLDQPRHLQAVPGQGHHRRDPALRVRVFEDFTHIREIANLDGRDHAFVFTATVVGKQLQGCDFCTSTMTGRATISNEAASSSRRRCTSCPESAWMASRTRCAGCSRSWAARRLGRRGRPGGRLPQQPRPRRALLHTRRGRDGAVTAHDLDARMLAQPSFQRVGGAVGQHVDPLICLGVDHHGGAAVPPAQSEVVDADHAGRPPGGQRDAQQGAQGRVRDRTAASIAGKRAPARPANSLTIALTCLVRRAVRRW